MSIEDRVSARFLQASDAVSPDKLAGELEALVKKRIELRRPLRDVNDHVQALKEDFQGVSGYPGPGDRQVQDTRDVLYELDHQIGQAFRSAEVLADKLRKFKPPPAW
jgi:hypothetical protein